MPECKTITIFTPDELERFKKEAFRVYSTERRKHKQAATFIFMLNTGLSIREVLGLLNKDISLEKRTLKIRDGVKRIKKRDGCKAKKCVTTKVGKPKTGPSKRTVPLNNTAIKMIKQLREECCFGENYPLVCDDQGGNTKPSNMQGRYNTILHTAGIEQKGTHSFRHTFATNLINGIRQPDGTIVCLTPKQVADILGHSTSGITERYYVKKDTARLAGITDAFEM